jgi:hypothetical protein
MYTSALATFTGFFLYNKWSKRTFEPAPTDTKIEDLPVELNEHVYSFLTVSDRARFRVAMKKTADSRFQYKCPEKERRLGLFVRSIKKRNIAELSFPMLQFLGTIDRDDPTLDEIAEVFPEAVANHRHGKTTPLNLADLIQDGSLTEQDVRVRMHEDLSVELGEWKTCSALYNCTPEQFDILIMHPDIRSFIDNDSFLYQTIRHTNEKLIVYMRTNSARLGIDMATHEQSLATYITKQAPDVIFKYTDLITVAIRNLPFTPDDLDLIWSNCLKVMNMDVVEVIDRFRGM